MRIRERLFVFGLLATVLLSCTAGISRASACSSLPPASSPQFLEHLTAFLNGLCYQKENWQHDAHVRTSDGVHPFVRVWYSPGLFDWMTVKNRNGPVPNGAIVVKEMYISLTAPLTEWTVMVKDSDLSWDGWYWAGKSESQKSERASQESRRCMRRAPSLVQRSGTVLSQLPRVGDREFGHLFEHCVSRIYAQFGARLVVRRDQ